NGLFGKELELERRQAGVSELAQPLRVRLRLFVGRTQERSRDTEEVAVQPVSDLEQVVAKGVRADNLLRLGNAVPRARRFLERRVGRDGIAQGFLRGLLALHQARVEDAGEFAKVGLAAVLNAEQVLLGAAGVLVAARAVTEQQHLEAAQAFKGVGQALVPDIFQFGDGEEATGAARMAGNEDQFVVRSAGLAPLEVMFDLGRLVVFVHAEQTDIEVETRILEVVRVAAVKGNLLFGREYQAN